MPHETSAQDSPIDFGAPTHSPAHPVDGGGGGHGPHHAPRRAPAAGPSTPEVDQQLIAETRNQIRSLVDEITSLSHSDCSLTTFYEGFLTRTLSALASVGGVVWSVGDGNQIQLEYQVNLANTDIADDPKTRSRHDQLLARLAESGDPALVPPHSGGQEDASTGNPTNHLLVIAPLMVNRKVVGLVEIFQRPESGPTTQRGYLRFLVQMSQIASDYLSRHQLRQFGQQRQMWQRTLQFIRATNKTLDVRKTVYAIANEGRRVAECDRVSVALLSGSVCRIENVSGLDTIERRADQIKRLNALVTAVARTGEAMWYTGASDPFPPQIEKHLQAYLDLSHSKLVAVVPLVESREPAPSEEREPIRRDAKPRTIGALIFEQLADEAVDNGLQQRTRVIAEHASDSLTRALDHEQIFLAPLWRWLGQTAVIFQARQLPRTALLLAALATIVAWLVLFPYSFTLGANGKMVPETRFEVYAQVDGVLQEIRVPDDPELIVQQGEVLAVMTNNDLTVEVETLEGQLRSAAQEVAKLNQALSHAQNSGANVAEQALLEGDISEAFISQQALQRTLNIKRHHLANLQIVAPATGQVVNWQLRQNLLHRPVQRGQNLMTLIDPATQWQVELEMPERRMVHLIGAQRRFEHPLEVTFALASHPGSSFKGRVVQVDQKLDVHSDEGNTALVRVAFDKTQLTPELLRSGTRVTAKVHVGRRSVGYVWFHELFETIHSTVGFWL